MADPGPDPATAPTPLAGFSEPTRTWFSAAFAGPTDAQVAAWRATEAGRSVLVSAPTGSGKTLAAFLAAIDRLAAGPPPSGRAGVRVLYVSPMKALAYDIDRNLRTPLVGIRRAAERLGHPHGEVTVAMRTGDTSAEERRVMARTPPDILITTPESLFLLLTSRARSMLAAVETVIVDEVHAVAGTKRGAHLSVSLERLEALVAHSAAATDGAVHGAGAPAPGGGIQRIGLSATQRPLDEVARFLGGGVIGADGAWAPRSVEVVEAAGKPNLDVEIVVPVADMSRLGEVIDQPQTGPAAGAGELRRSIWPHVLPRVHELVMAHRSTIVFANSRRLAERLCAQLNDIHAEAWLAEVDPDGEGDPGTPPLLARAHHGSVARTERVEIEEALKAGRLRCVVATSSLELGIDMGAVDLVVQIESPGSVASGLQRIGRAGHQVGAASVGKVFPKYRGDLVECAVVVRRMRDAAVEATRYPRNTLDVLAQQVVAMAAMDPWAVDDLHRTVRGAAGFADLGRSQLDGVLDMLSGRYPSDEFAELRPRITWDRVADRIEGRPNAQRLAVTSGGTIPDRGLYGVFIAGEGEGGQSGRGSPRGEGGRQAAGGRGSRRGEGGRQAAGGRGSRRGEGGRQAAGGRGSRRVGELDEEMVYEMRPGETFTLGSTTWRCEDITRDQVLVTPAPGEPGKLPFWHGDALGRPIEVGRAVGAFLREVGELGGRAVPTLTGEYGLDELAATNLVAYLGEQVEATGVLPSDRSIVIERTRDEIGDWRICVHSPFGGRVHAPWALAIEARLRERLGRTVQTMWADDGIVVRLGEADDAPPGEAVVIDADEVEDLVVSELGDSALFSSRFREAAARALLLPRRRPDGRTPLWQQRQRSAELLAVASKYGSFPVLLETYRECLRDVFDLPALIDLLRDIAARRVRVVSVDTPQASPFASSLLFGYVASYMYEGDAPLAERRASALSLDRELLAELLGSDELRDLIDADALGALELELQRLEGPRRPRDADEVHDLLRAVGDLTTAEIADRVVGAGMGAVAGWLDDLEVARRAYRVRVAGEERWAAAEDAARYRDALGVPPAPGLPEAFGEPVDRPTVDLVARFARTHGPFTLADVMGRLGLPRDAVELACKELEREGRVVVGAFRPGGTGEERCDAGVLRRLRRASLAALRREVEAVEQPALGRFLPAWQGVGSNVPGPDRLFEVVEQLAGAPIPASVLERDVLAARVRNYTPAWLDELAAVGDIIWSGRGPIGSGDGRVALYPRTQAALLLPPPPEVDALADEPWWSDAHAGLLAHLAERGASFWPQLLTAARAATEAEAVEALWDLVWAGAVTNDTLAPLRALVGGGVVRRRGGGGRRRRPGRAVSRSGHPTAAGRWSLVAEVRQPAPTDTERAASLAATLLDRHGVLVRDAVVAEGVQGGFSAVYGVLRAMEESGRARRGYFVEGLGGAQFAMPGAIDRLRAAREVGLDADADAPVALAATDPAQPFGAALAWPTSPEGVRQGPRRVAGAHVVLVAGEVAAFSERGGRSLVCFTTDDEVLAAVADRLGDLVRRGSVDAMTVAKVNGEPVADQPIVAHLRAAGFADHPRGLVLRA